MVYSFFFSALRSEVFKPFSVLPLLFSIYYTHCFFFFFPPMHQFVYLQSKSFEIFNSLPPPQLSMSSPNPKETWLKGPHEVGDSIALPQGFPLYLVLWQCSLCCLQLLLVLFHMLMGVSYALEVAMTFEGMLFYSSLPFRWSPPQAKSQFQLFLDARSKVS